MKILSIKIKNLASLEGISEIDFTKEPLVSAGIFAITGATGAGKSTILDALCLALFAQTPRHTQAKESGIEIADGLKNKLSIGDIKGILRKGTADGFAEVTFIGIDGNKYTAIWKVKRAFNKIEGSLQADTVELINAVTTIKFGGKKTDTLKEIERLVGLNFTQFTRSVLLAQGDFTAFLKAEKKEKSSLLEKLTGTDIYSEISVKIREKYNEKKLELNELVKQMGGIQLLAPEDIELLNTKIAEINTELNSLKSEEQTLITAISWHTTFVDIENSIDAANNELQNAGEIKLNVTDRIKKIDTINEVQEIRSKVESKENSIKILEKNDRELNKINAEIEILEQQLKIKEEELQVANENLKQCETNYENAKPLIDKAKEQDTLIKEKNVQLDALEKEVTNVTKKKEEQIKEIENKQKENDIINNELESIHYWINTHNEKKSIAENTKLIVSKLNDASILLQQENTIETNLTNTKALIEKNEKMYVRLVQQLKSEEAKLSVVNITLYDQQKKLTEYSIEDLKHSESNFSNLFANLVSAKACWDLFYKNTIDLNKCKLKIDTNKKDLESKTTEQENTKAELEKARIKKEYAEKMYRRAELETAKDVVSLRTNLADQDPCPVCGSTHHPYKTEQKQLNTILVVLKKEYDNCTISYNQFTKQGNILETEIININNILNTSTIENEELTKENKELSSKWIAFEIDEACIQLPDTEKSNWLQNQIYITKEALDNNRKYQDEYNQLNKLFEAQKEKQIRVKEDIQNITQEIKNSENTKQITNSDLNRYNTELDVNKQRASEIEKELNIYFSTAAWWENWKKEPEKFINSVISFSTDWHRKILLLDETNKKLENHKTILSGLIYQKENFENTIVKDTITNFKNIQTEILSYKAKRKELFNNRTISEVEAEFNTAIDNCKKATIDITNQLNVWRGILNRNHGTKKQLENSIKDNKKELLDINEQINAFIIQYNLNKNSAIDEIILYELLSYSNEWLVAEKKWLNDLNTNLYKAETILKERTTLLEKHIEKKQTDKSIAELEIDQTELKAKIDTITTHKSEYEYTLRQDADNKNKVGFLQEKINVAKTIFEDWQKLDDLLGSADGDKFRQIAQEYTLEILLSYANNHLQFLAARYELERIPNSLALQVKDKEMGDEIRSVHSLSGGESFLVSLALALGLASLSSNKMKVESLFIDEGFGSLDGETLSVAMDALERLHNQGRKVGVISHVYEMTERIHTQIKVTKQLSGKSKMEVIG